MRPLLPALLVATLFACGHKAGDTCQATDATQCDSSTSALSCINGAWAQVPCSGPLGCSHDACDTTVALTGQACPTSTTSLACQTAPSAVLSCTDGVWANVQSCGLHGCSITNGMAACGSPSATGGGSGSTGGGSGSTGGGSGSTGGGSTSTDYPAPHPDYPQEVNLSGADSVLKAPHIQAITFANDTADMVAAAEDFVATLGPTTYWSSVATEYGIGGITTGAPVRLAERAPIGINDAVLQTWLREKLTAADAGAEFDPPTSNSLYVIFYPASTHVSYGGTQSCQYFFGYHGGLVVNGQHVAYAVIPRCSESGKTLTQVMSSTTSHEIIEAATDPWPDDQPGYAQVDDAHFVWEAMLLSEVGDLCAQDTSSFFTPANYSYEVQRSWSNAAARAGKDPCQPELPGEVYFAAVPVLEDDVIIGYQGYAAVTKGVKIAVGATKTIDVKLFSEGPHADWTVRAGALSDGMAPSNALSFGWDRNSGTTATPCT